MSIVENLVNQISTKGLGGITKPFGFDMEDDTFAKLLEKQMNSTQELNSNNFVGSMGAPAGLVIEPLEGVNFSETVQDQMEVIGENKLSRDEYINQPIEFKDIDMGDYFSNLLKTDSGKNSDFMNFAKKNATNAYNVFTKNLVMNASEFVEDILNT
jgi:hypothetical protein